MLRPYRFGLSEWTAAADNSRKTLWWDDEEENFEVEINPPGRRDKTRVSEPALSRRQPLSSTTKVAAQGCRRLAELNICRVKMHTHTKSKVVRKQRFPPTSTSVITWPRLQGYMIAGVQCRVSPHYFTPVITWPRPTVQTTNRNGMVL